MEYQLAQLNIARFRLPQEDPVNADFVNNLDRVNSIADQQPGFVWRLVGEGNNAMDIQAFDDQHIASNLSVWKDVASLEAFVFSNEAHRDILRRRREWFDKLEFYLVLWWVRAGHRPDLEEAKERLECLQKNGPGPEAFTFRDRYPRP
jgi:Domain of unknown function (DUF3291)